MKIAVLTDIHGNMEALEAVLRDISDSAIDLIVSLGDNIGYGPEPEAVNRLLMDRKIPSVLGNHEYAVLHPEVIDSFSFSARESILITRNLLTDESIRFISSLPRYILKENCRFVHGVPPDSTSLYIHELDQKQLNTIFGRYDESICFVGHTHRLGIILFDGKNSVRAPLSREKISLDMKRRYIVNSGSVGQPRDGDNHAKYAIWDTEKYILDIHYVAYDIAGVVKKIKSAGLPLINARRLM